MRFCTGCGLATAEILKETERDTRRETTSVRGRDASDPRDSSDPLVGRTLDSKYELVAPLGEGGMGTVYRARRLHIGDEVAVKVLHRRFLPDEAAVERFRREARSAALLTHPNVVTIHDFADARPDGAPAYIVMELVKGVSLRGLLKREGRLDERRAVELMGDICAGVGVGHKQGVVHRDLKPDNVIITPPAVEGAREAAKVVDFGIAKLRDATGPLDLTQTGALLGTPLYMAPEQCRGERLGPSADVYSLGAMLYEMLTGAPPFRANTLPALISKHLTEEPPLFPPGLNLSPALEGVYLRALSKNSAARQTDANVFYQELRSALSESATAARHDSRMRSHVTTAPAVRFATPPPQTPTTSSRRWMWAVGGVLLLLVCTAAAVPLAWYVLSQRSTGDHAATVSKSPTPERVAGSVQTSRTADEPVDREPETAAGDYGNGLKGRWAGTYGPLGQSASFEIKEARGSRFSGVLEQNGVRVAVEGELKGSTREVTLKETRVLSGKGWVLGMNNGTLSADGRRMSGTGGDPIGAQLGISYGWSFSKR
ncbi:MAG TPA: serine/threonine-protein kinase [Pyrinomonadaceae bacterium]